MNCATIGRLSAAESLRRHRERELSVPTFRLDQRTLKEFSRRSREGGNGTGENPRVETANRKIQRRGWVVNGRRRGINLTKLGRIFILGRFGDVRRRFYLYECNARVRASRDIENNTGASLDRKLNYDVASISFGRRCDSVT